MDRPLPKARRRRHPLRRALLYAISTALALAIITNGAMLLLYRNKALPRAHLGRLAAGGMTYTALGTSPPETILPALFTLQKGSTHSSLAPSALGLSVDVPASIHGINGWQRWLPIVSLFMQEDIPLHTHLDAAVYAAASSGLANTFSAAALPQHIIFNGASFAAAPASNGYALDTASLPGALTSAADAGSGTVLVPTKTVAAPAGSGDLSSAVQTLQKQLTTKISFIYKNQHIDPSIQDIGGWYTASGQSMAPATERITAYLKNSVAKQAGITIVNPNDLATAVAYALAKNLSLNLALVPQTSTTVVRTYCTAVRDVSESVFDDLIGKLAATYNDTRGWNNSGQIAFEHVDSGCQYTVWMSAAAQMTSFGAICDDYYNCQVGGNVVLNYDRWTSATDPWNATHGSIEDYRTLMIDHETGHRLGFLDNPTCPGTGQLAPVMMQQSINLKGCVFNVWPLAAEFAQLDASLGLPATTATAE